LGGHLKFGGNLFTGGFLDPGGHLIAGGHLPYRRKSNRLLEDFNK
jgi:hypothetical protein